ncbi:MAG: sugar ABC transporter ATP-binding protein [Planctomycetota bacterium]
MAEVDKIGRARLEMRGVARRFGATVALDGVDLSVAPGEVHALLGENGAGKSTLIKILGGAHAADRGSVVIDGRQAEIADPVGSQRLGVAIIYQEFDLVPDLTVSENVFLGCEMSRYGLIQQRREQDAAAELFKRIGLEIDPSRRCCDLTVAEQQTVEIAKALNRDARIIIMDEPTAALTTQEVGALFAIIRDLKSKGIGVIYISHRLDEVFEIADRVMVLRDGEHVGTEPVGDIDKDALIEMMVGRSLESEFPKQPAAVGQETLRVENLSRGEAVQDVSFSVRAGEVLGFAGLVGAGRTETMRLIFGADQADSGKVFVGGNEASIGSPRDALRYGICLLTEDRKSHGLILAHSVRENFGLPNMDRFARRLFVDRKRESKALAGYVESLRIKIADVEQATGRLSGGNQQKVVLAKWLERNCDIIIFDEPTRGIDVGAKYEIYLLMNHLAAGGKTIIMVSSELPEILGMSDRVIVMHEGRITGEITDVESATQEEILSLAIA